MAEVQMNAATPSKLTARFRAVYEAGRQAYLGSNGQFLDPAGEDHEHDRLRAMGKWRFILLRGIVGFGVPMFLWMVIYRFREDALSAHYYKHSIMQSLLRSWVFALCTSAFFAAILGLLAWRRLTSDYWPRTKADPESTLTRMDPL